jgi:segregation and condensation protein A
MMDSSQSRDDAARTNGAADEELTGQPSHDVSPSAEESAVAASPEQLHLPANPPFAPEHKDKAAEASARAAERAAERKAAQEEANTFPYGVTVGHVYDGPLDLLLDLIRKQDIDIYDIPIAKITGQFLAYIENLKQSDIDGAGEFIYMASLLIHIKSKMLLPRSNDGTTDAADEDPRRELVERLLEHQRFKNAAQMLLQKQMLEESSWTNPAIHEFLDDAGTEPEIAADTVDLVRVFREILERARQRPVLNVDEDTVTVAQMIDYVRRRLVMEDRPVGLRRLLQHVQSERALICTFLALLELVRLQAILLWQTGSFGEIYVKKHDNFESTMVEGRDDWR